MAKYTEHTVDEKGWTEEFAPPTKLWKVACCDCGLVHDFQLSIVKVIKTRKDSFTWQRTRKRDFAIMVKVRRNTRSTGQKRRHMKDGSE